MAPPGEVLVKATRKPDTRVYRAEIIDGGKWHLLTSVEGYVLLRKRGFE